MGSSSLAPEHSERLLELFSSDEKSWFFRTQLRGGGGNSPGRANIGSGLPNSRAAKEAQLASSDTVPKQNKKKQAKPAESAVLHMGNVMLGSCN